MVISGKIVLNLEEDERESSMLLLLKKKKRDLVGESPEGLLIIKKDQNFFT